MTESIDIANLPSDWWQREAVCLSLRNWFEHHIVGLHVGYFYKGEPMDRLFTGFLVQHRGLTFWVTAGHVIEHLEELIDNPDLTPDHAGWMDRSPVSLGGPIPVCISDLTMGRLRPNQPDVGFVLLNQLTISALVANTNVEFVDSQIWLNHESAKADGYYVLGYPREWLKTTGRFKDENGQMRRSLNMGVACLPITPVQDLGRGENAPLDPPFWGCEHSMYAKLMPCSDTNRHVVNNIDGMSGGPVLSIECSTTGDLTYRLFGIQSAWQSRPKIVKATRVGVLDTIVEHVADQFEAAALSLDAADSSVGLEDE